MLKEFKNIFRHTNNSHIRLIAINVIIFSVMAIIFRVVEIANEGWLVNIIERQFMLPPKFSDFMSRPWTLLTYAFAHSLNDIFHILFNMLVLYWFGKLFVEYWGSDKLIDLYVLGAIAGGITYLLVYNTIPYFVERSNFFGMVGASASVYAIVAATATFLPNYTFYLLFFGPIRIKYIAIFYIVVSFLGTVGVNAGGNIAHLGGALMGYVYARQLQHGFNIGRWVTETLEWVTSLFKHTFKFTVNRKSVLRKEVKKNRVYKQSSVIESTSQEEIDMILDKISDSGYESLTADEKKKLFNASKN